MKKFKLIALGVVIALAVGCAERQEGAAPLVVGMELAYPPFEMRGQDNEPDGISVRLARDLAAYLGRPLRIHDVQWDGIIPALQSGKIDLIISSMTRTEERAESIDFSDGYVTNGLCMLVERDSPLQGVDDIRGEGKKVAVKLATTGHLWARENLPAAQLTVLDEASMCVLEVVQGKADAFIYDQISVFKHWKQHEEETRPILKPIREETWAIGVRKGEDELREKVNAFLREYRENGKFEALANEFMAEERRAFEEAGVPFIFH